MEDKKLPTEPSVTPALDVNEFVFQTLVGAPTAKTDAFEYAELIEQHLQGLAAPNLKIRAEYIMENGLSREQAAMLLLGSSTFRGMVSQSGLREYTEFIDAARLMTSDRMVRNPTVTKLWRKVSTL